MPIVEPLDLYLEKSGEEIAGQLFHFEDKGGRKVALRPELTPPSPAWSLPGQTLCPSQLNGLILVNISGMKGPKKAGVVPSINLTLTCSEKPALMRMQN